MKYKMIHRFYYILVFCYLISISAVVLEIYIRTNLDFATQWHYVWIIEASWFTIFSLFQLATCVLMRPTSTSRLLAYVEELGDQERSTQPGVNERDQSRHEQDGIEMQAVGKQAERERLDRNDIKSDDFVVVLER